MYKRKAFQAMVPERNVTQTDMPNSQANAAKYRLLSVKREKNDESVRVS